MILGIGIDLIKIDRIEKLYLKYKDKFVTKVLSEYEVSEASALKSQSHVIQYLAKRFVAKEALVKAIGTGFTAKTLIRDIMVKNDRRGKPYYHLSHSLDKFIQELFKTKYVLHLSISDDKENAIANALIETSNDLLERPSS